MDDRGISAAMGLNGLVSIIVTLACIALAWWALQTLKLDLLIRRPKSPQAKLLYLFLAVIVGRWVAEFILQYWQWTQQLRWMF
ncbi:MULTISPECIES: DUF1146 family protein [unclassified Paenibacillus]|uniref:DUF1146 family protein n=1 Tax=unclassified Paenibacillus TaxID=185978 RepID=UPI001C105774|nr:MULTISPECIES: DUF1146 family protein [unclassified Paenibacillus]MBU5440941.1 DUF1146 family protein [Paenibacillus sp. MSJ-34]CAH0118059.1 hypothetical protein PAE9249_00524 [Paenibacillus sp. CECT 9249]